MLSRFVLPVRRLEDLNAYRKLFAGGDPFRLSVLGTGGGNVETFLAAFGRDLEVIESFNADHEGHAQVDVMEVPIPEALEGSSRSDFSSFLEPLHRTLVEKGTAKLDLFLEIPMRMDALKNLPAFGAVVADHNSRQPLPARNRVGFKMRCGGAEPSAVPAVEEASFFIMTCRDAGVPFKATAGLHHPIRHYDDGLDTEMHGFLNIFGAAALAFEHALDRPDIEMILSEETSDNFRFLKNAFAWRNLSVPLDEIRHVRDTLALSFGSCSFEEPIDHLRDLELL